MDGDTERLKVQHQAEINRLRSHYLRVIAIVAGTLGSLLALFLLMFFIFRAVDMRSSNREASAEQMDWCISCESEITQHSQYCAWCGHEQGGKYNT